MTDELSSIVLVPRVTSRHRHYLQFTPLSEEEVRKAIEHVKREGFEVIQGHVQEVMA